MVKIAIISAMEIELAPLFENLASDSAWIIRDKNIYINRELNLSIYGGVLGVGKVNAAYRTAEILLEFSPDLVINVGYAGGMKAGAYGGDIVIGNDYRQIDFRALVSGYEPGIVPFAKPFVIPEEFIRLLELKSRDLSFNYHVGRIATGDFFLSDSDTKNKLVADFSPVAYDMESAAIAHVCAEKGTAFVAVRTLSDLANDHAEKTIKKLSNREAKIEQKPIKLVLSVLRDHPTLTLD